MGLSQLPPRSEKEGSEHVGEDGCRGASVTKSAQRTAHRSCQNRPLSGPSNHVLLRVIVLLADGLLEQEIRPFEHHFACSEHSG